MGCGVGDPPNANKFKKKKKKKNFVKKNVLCEKGDEITRFDGILQINSKITLQFKIIQKILFYFLFTSQIGLVLMNYFQPCFICRPSVPTVPEETEVEPRCCGIVATLESTFSILSLVLLGKGCRGPRSSS
jgi:hypothetical protein